MLMIRQLFSGGNSAPELKQRAEMKTQSVFHWTEVNFLIANEKKIRILLIGNTTACSNVSWKDFCISVGNATIYPSESIKLLGVLLDKRLTYEDHIGQVLKKTGCSSSSLT